MKNKTIKRPDPLLALVGEKIRALRESQGYSQEDFANRSGISRAFYGRIERGEKNFSINLLLRIALTLNVDAGKLFPRLSQLNKLKDKL